MEVKKQENNNVWDKWLIENSCFSSFSQSFKWGKILENEGERVERLLVLDENNIVAQAQVVYKNLFFGLKYAFCPKGPVINVDDKTKNDDVLNILGKYLNGKECVFFRIEPSDNLKSDVYKIISSKDINPRSTLVLDLSKTEAEILSNMHHKTRYNIHLSERKGVIIKQEKDLDKFFSLMEKTGQRDGFRLHSKKHYEEILKSDLSFQFNAYKDGNIIASAVFIGFGDTFTYLYGASDYSSRNLMAPNLLQWEGIKMGKKLGYKFYDFFGIAPCVGCHSDRSLPAEAGEVEESLIPKSVPGKIPRQPACRRGRARDDKNQMTNKNDYDVNHQYAGVTRFKLGFGGEYREDAGTFDLILNNKKYLFYKFLRRVRRMF